jgi:hypothetical protein
MNRNDRTKGGSGNKKMKKFPRILDYLEAHHKDVYDIIDDLAMHGALTPKRGGSITFLIPDKKYIGKIRKAIESDKPEEATDMIGSLILLDLFETPSDFSEKQDDVPNLLGKKITIKGVAGSKVNVDDGELTVDTGFKPFERQGSSKRGNLAVWELKGEIKYEGAPSATFKYAKTPQKGSKRKEGGGEHSEICKLVYDITKEEVDCIRQGTGGPNNYKSPMLNAVACVMRGLMSDPNLNDEYLKARSILTKHPIIDFYLLFQTPDVFPADKILTAHKAGKPDINNNVETIKNFFKKTIADAAVLNYDLLAELNRAKDELRSNIRESVNLKLNEKVIRAYNEIDENNKLIYMGTTYYAGKLYPDVLANVFKSHKNLHLALDEAMYFIYTVLRRIKSSTPDWEAGRPKRAEEYAALFMTIKDCFGKLGDPNKSMVLRPPIDSHDIYQTTEFWREFGLHLPMSIAEFENAADERVIRGGSESLDIYSKDLVDVDKEIECELCNYDNSDLTLSDNTVAELKAYLKANDGKFPTL